jgi:hypothetical protein
MTRLFGALLAEDNADFAPIYSIQNKTIQRTHVATLTAPAGQNGRVLDANHVPLDPQAHFTIQAWSAIQTMTQFPATYDQTYMDSTRTWVDGSTEAVTVANPDVNTVSFTDPWSHQTYRALHIGTAAGEGGYTIGPSAYVHATTNTTATESGVAARMLLHIQDIDTLRKAAVLKNDTATAQTLETQERKYLDLINVMRDLTKTLGQGYSASPQ